MQSKWKCNSYSFVCALIKLLYAFTGAVIDENENHRRNEVGKWAQRHNPCAPNHFGSNESLRGALKSSNNVKNTFFNAVNLLPKDIKFEHGGASLAPCHGRHFTSLRPWENHT